MFRLSTTQRTILSTILMAAAMIWLSASLRENFDRIVTAIISFRPNYLGMALASLTGEGLTLAYIYFLVISRYENSDMSARAAAVPFIASKIVRYLPGRIWGVIYQINITDQSIPVRHTVEANLEHYFLVNINSISVALSAFIYYSEGPIFALGVFACATVLLFFLLKRFLFQRAVYLVKKIRGDSEPFLRRERNNKNTDLLAICLLQLAWGFYILACMLILPSNFGIKDIVTIASCYAAAGIAGIFAPMAPKGLFVLEASFMWLSGIFGYDPTLMLAFAIIVRILYTLADVVCAFLSMTLLYLRNIGVREV